MKRSLYSRALVALGIILGLALLVVIAFPGYLAAVLGPPLDRAKAHRVLIAAKTQDQLQEAVGSLGAVFLLQDGSWIAIRYTDSHAYPGYSCAVALDSNGHWFYSRHHFCGRFRIYQQTEKRLRQLAVAGGDDESSIDEDLKAHDPELHALATAATLEAAHAQLRAMGFTD